MNKFKKIISKLFPKKHLTNSNSGKSFDEIYNDLGCFKYDENGFTLKYEDFNITVKWEEITQLNAYKKDLITIDQIEMEIVRGEKYFVISEELPGWFQFIIKTKEVFPTIPKDWEIKIIQPEFAKNYTNIYKKMISEEELIEIEKRANYAQKGPWKAYIEGRDHESGSDFIMTGFGTENENDIELIGARKDDYDFIANARQDIPKLVAEIRELKSKLTKNTTANNGLAQ